MSSVLCRPFIYLYALSILTVSTFGCRLFPESTFELASGSRLPKWISVQGNDPKQLHLSMSYFTSGMTEYTLTNDKGKVLQRISGRESCSFNGDGTQGSIVYPSYQAVNVNGSTEIMEHQKMEPLFWVTDKTDIWQAYAKVCK